MNTNTYISDGLHVACKEGNIAEVIVERLNDPEFPRYRDGALVRSAVFGHIEIVKFMVEGGANIHAWNDEALRVAVRYGHLEIAKYLVEQGGLLEKIPGDEIAELVIKTLTTKEKENFSGYEVIEYLIENGITEATFNLKLIKRDSK